MSSHWHYASSMPAQGRPSVIETMTSPETTLGKDDAKRMLQPVIRMAQGNARYPDPGDPAKLWEPADWWMHAGDLVWLTFPAGPNVIFAVYPCEGDCAGSALAHRAELAGYLEAAGMDVTLEARSGLS